MLLRLLLPRLGSSRERVLPEDIKAYNLGVVEAINKSMLDRVVLLALDSAHDENGLEIDRGDGMVCSNGYIAGLCKTGRKALFGASIHPYRKDALALLERCLNNGACLVKWIPSAQNIDPENDKCLPFYDMLAAYKLPLLCHAGNEHTLTGRNNEFNNPARLVPALKRGVTVIAAHCGARMFLHEKSYFDSWSRLALDYEKCYGDISAFVIPTRIHLFQRLKRDGRLLEKLLYGSDFPGFPVVCSSFFSLGAATTVRLRREANLFNRHLLTVRELGLPEEVFTRAGRLLRIAGSREKPV